MWNNRFIGWYFKHQREGETIAFIPGKAKGEAFVQMIYNDGSRYFNVPDLRVRGGAIHAGACAFSCRGASISLPGVQGEILYGPLAPLNSPIMGPFHHLPMECHHALYSMRHSIYGSITVDGQHIKLDGGLGYIEGDCGTSFPSSYLWLQCNSFAEPCGVMISIASIPFLGFCFTGCICAIIYKGREYRLATYKGVRILAAGPEHITLSQGDLLLRIAVKRLSVGHPLRSPIRGRMEGMIRESNRVCARFMLWEKDALVLDLESDCAGYEFVG